MPEGFEHDMMSVIIDRTANNPERVSKRPAALLWDESFLWGVMAWRSLKQAALPFDLIRADEVREGGLSRYGMIFVPGGWASNKIETLGQRGREEIRRFVSAGGSYLGICGGAGLAMANGLNLLPIRRRASAERVPSFSGRIRLSCTGHRIWQNVETPIFHAWWPSQFETPDPSVLVLARYDEPQADAFSSDIPVIKGAAVGWSELEQRYGILLDPGRLRGEPAVVEGRFGRGRVILSLIHFDTPGNRDGAVVIKNIWNYLTTEGVSPIPVDPEIGKDPSPQGFSQNVYECLREIEAVADDLISTGERKNLWRWRNPFLLRWRRGVRGLEYTTLAVMIAEIRNHLDQGFCEHPGVCRELSEIRDPSQLLQDLTEVRRQLGPFAAKANRLLLGELSCMQKGPLSPLACDDEDVRSLRQELFGSTMSHEGDFKDLIDAVDRVLYSLIR